MADKTYSYRYVGSDVRVWPTIAKEARPGDILVFPVEVLHPDLEPLAGKSDATAAPAKAKE